MIGIGIGIPRRRPVFGGATQSLREQVIAALGDDLQTFQTSDLATLFTTANGSTNSVLNDPVGLRLDISQGLTLGSELWTDPPSVLPADWTDNSDGTYTYDGTQDAQDLGTQTGLAAGSMVEVTFDVTGYTSGTGVYLGLQTGTFSGNGSKVFRSQVRSDGTILIRGNNTNAGLTVGNVSIKELPGNHARQATSADRPSVTGDPTRITYGAGDDLDTSFPASLGSACTVARSIPTTGASILTAQTVGTTFTDSTNNHVLLIVDRALTGEETTLVTAMLDAEAGL